MAVLSTGQITIIDYNDALSLQAYIASNQTKTQMFNQDNESYAPDWTTKNVVLTPSLFKLGVATDIIGNLAVKSAEWYDVKDGIETKLVNDVNYAVATVAPYKLTIKKNVLAGLPGKDYMCKIIYHDDSTNLDLTIKTDISFSRVVNGSGIADAIAWLPEGNVFKNGTKTSLTAQCDMWRGSTIDTTNVTYQWYQQSSTQLTDVGGGIGWKKLTNTPSKTTGVTTNVLTMFADVVASYEVFKCVIKDTDVSSTSFNKSFMDTVTVADQSDPVQCTVTSSGGNIFKNEVGSSVLTAKLYRGGVEIDKLGTAYTYKWYMYDSKGDLVLSWGGSPYKTGKTITVNGDDVTVKATFSVEVEG